MEPTLYNILLFTNAGINMMLSIVMVLAAINEKNFYNYRKSLLFTAFVYIVFAAGFIIHWQFQWRSSSPYLASTLSLTYFHIAAVFMSWGQIGLCDSHYLSSKIVIRDLIILCVGILCYWYNALDLISYSPESTIFPLSHTIKSIVQYSCIIFLIHSILLAITFYKKYYTVQHQMLKMHTNSHIRRHIRFMVLSCHLIIAFGIGGIIITGIFPTQQWPYCILLTASIIVFSYIAISLILYSDVIKQTNSTIEQISHKQI